MPIKPENKHRYPSNWKDIRADILKRANNKCEFCGIENYTIKENGARVVLTIAHLDQMPEHNDYSNLRALCQKCHNNWDMPYRIKNRKKQKPITEEHRQNLKKYHNQPHVIQNFIDRISKRVICIETGEVYKSIAEASRKNNINPAGISKCCCGILKTFKKRHWKFYKEGE